MKLININDINYTTNIIMEIQSKKDFLGMLGEYDEDTNEAYVFKLDKGTHIEYFGFGEDITYIYTGDWNE